RPQTLDRIPWSLHGVLLSSSPNKASARLFVSSKSPPVSPLLTVRKRAGMNHEDCIIRVEQLDHLHIPTALALPNHQELIIPDLLRKRRTGSPDHRFCLVRANTVFFNMI